MRPIIFVGNVLKTLVGYNIALHIGRYGDVLRKIHWDVMFQRPMDVDKRRPQDVGRGRPLALHR